MSTKREVDPVISARRKAKWQDPEYRAMMAASPARKAAFSGIAVAGRAVAMQRVRGKEHPGTRKATVRPTIRDIAWAAGFIEGEGHFRPRSQVTAVQADMEPLSRLVALFGGSIVSHTRADNPKGWKQSWAWRVSGARARGVALTLYPLLSTRRQIQVRGMLTHVG